MNKQKIMHNRKPRIAIIVEVKKREMPFMSILQEVLKHKGYEVKLVPFRSLCTWRLMFFHPDIVLINGLRHEDPYFIKQVYIPKKLFKSKIACYYSEQVGYYNESIAKGYYNTVIFENVDYHIAWGPHFAKDLMALGVPKEKLWYIGSVQYDIDKYLKKSFDAIKKELSTQFGIPIEKKWILYADNIIESFQKSGYYELRRRETFDMVEKIAIDNPNSCVIFRHHPDSPASDVELAKKRFENIKNVFVIPQGHIFDWTCSISALVIWVSTSSLQTMFMGKPVFGFMTSDGKDMEYYWHRDIFPTYKEADRLSAAINRTLANVENEEDLKYAENREYFVKDWYFKKDGYSFERLCFLLDIVNNGPYYPLTGAPRYGFLKCFSILYLELQAWGGDVLKGRNKERNLFRSEIWGELKKYDVSRCSDISFEILESECGYYLS